MDTLPDYLRTGLAIVSVGLNPSIPSVRSGFYFANPRNRFWPALNASALVPESITPGVTGIERLYRERGIGFTDVVKRPTPGASALRAADFRRWAPVLQRKLLEHAPRIAWFHGKLALSGYLRHAHGLRGSIDWGVHPFSIGSTRVFVTPNPSPANAVFSLVEITGWYTLLAEFARESDVSPGCA